MTRNGLPERLAALEDLVALGEGRLEPEHLAAAESVLRKARERLARGDAVVVAALCGGTGTGKSSLLNALAGAPLAPTGVRRPTTTSPRAWATGADAHTGPLLDWLDVPERHLAGDPKGSAGGAAGGLVVVDLPDIDSVVTDHQRTVDRFVERVDVLVWVVDPLKYAQRVLHDGYLRRLADHAEVVLVVLNRADEVSADASGRIAEDLRRLLDEDGLERARVLVTSAETGAGIAELRDALLQQARRRQAVAARLTADVRAVARALPAGLAPARAGDRVDAGAVVGALAGAVGVPALAARAGVEYREVAGARSRPLVSRLVALLVGRITRVVAGARALSADLRRATRPRPPGGPAAVRSALLRLVEDLARDLPVRWRERLRSVVGDPEDLTRAVRSATDRVQVPPPRRRWWRLTAALLSVVELVALTGALWLAGLATLAYLQLPPPPTPMVAGRLPWPTALLAGGLVLRVAGGLVRRVALRAGAARHRARVQARLLAAVEQVAARRVVAPLRADLEAHDRLRELSARLGD